MDPRGGTLGLGAQLRVERHVLAAADLAVVQGAAGNGNVEHLFETQRLSAELHAVCVVGFGPSTLVLDRERLPATGNASDRGSAGVSSTVHLDDVRFADKTEPVIAKREAAGDTHVAAGLRVAGIRGFVKRPSVRGQRVLDPQPFYVNERALALAEHEVLEGGDGDWGVWINGHGFSSSSTPSGTRSACTVTL